MLKQPASYYGTKVLTKKAKKETNEGDMAYLLRLLLRGLLLGRWRRLDILFAGGDDRGWLRSNRNTLIALRRGGSRNRSVRARSRPSERVRI